MSVVRHYFAYGSNMNPARVAERGLRWLTALPAALPGFELVFNKRSTQHPGAHANIRVCQQRTVHGVLYEWAVADEIAKMDRFEVAPINYSREVFLVQTLAGAVPCWVYVANAAVIQNGLAPEREYLNHLLAGIEFLPAAYLEWLRATPCLPQT